jgi:nitrate/nitrite-specific signal transduction histidine kinase
MLSVIMLSVIMLSVIMLNVIMLSVIMLSVIMLNVVAPSNQFKFVAEKNGHRRGRIQELYASEKTLELIGPIPKLSRK